MATVVEGTQTSSSSVGRLSVPTGCILCSSKWFSTELATCLKGSCRVIFEDSLDAVDFYPSQHIGVVYVTEADLVSGQGYKRKLAKLRMANKVQVVILAEKTSTSAQYFAALQKFTVLELGLTLLPVLTQTEAAHILIQIAKLDSNPQGNAFRLKPNASPPDAAVLATVQLIPKLGEVKARALLERFPSIIDICNASAEEIGKIVGKQCASHVVKFFNEPNPS